ncbi:MAG: elongation factor P [Chloroflexi bacterium]|nr:MAG: elongation factor P [Chloroflexota bacterium]
MISTNDFRNGTMFEMDGQLLSIVTVEHIKLARAGAVIKAKLRNVLTGSIFEQSFRSGDKYKTARIDRHDCTYLYSDGSHHYFMDSKTYDQVAVDEDMLTDVIPFLKEGSEAYLLRHDDRLIGVELPIIVELKVAQTDPGFKGDTVSGATKR